MWEGRSREAPPIPINVRRSRRMGSERRLHHRCQAMPLTTRSTGLTTPSTGPRKPSSPPAPTRGVVSPSSISIAGTTLVFRHHTTVPVSVEAEFYLLVRRSPAVFALHRGAQLCLNANLPMIKPFGYPGRGGTGLAATHVTLAGGSARPTKFLLSVVIPCFNEEDVLFLTYRRLVEALGSRDFRLQIVFVDDGSADNTPKIHADFCKNDPRIKAVLLSRNFGHQAAVSAGLASADGDAVVVMDADLQDPPEVVLQMIREWSDGADVVYGIRIKRKESLPKRIAYKAFYRVFQRLANIDSPATLATSH